jgi:hypothetical protein
VQGETITYIGVQRNKQRGANAIFGFSSGIGIGNSLLSASCSVSYIFCYYIEGKKGIRDLEISDVFSCFSLQLALEGREV